jgi:maltooligosyltrehalose trehalohydrolase
MHRFEVWAPYAKSLAVQVGGNDYPMTKMARDVWRADVEQAGPGTDYGFVIDGDGPAIPDPRSLWQPDGVNGLSRLVDHDAFEWHDHGFIAPPLPSAVIYELHIGTFTPEGTLDAAIGKMDYLRDLGITHIEVLPLAASPGNRGWGYDGVALFAPHESYGGPAAVKRFVDAAHTRGLAVLHDVVYNHFGPSGNYTGRFGPYLNDNHKTPWGGAVNLEEGGSDEVRRFFCDNALMWLREYHFDGLRLDAVTAYVDRSAIHFLEQLSYEVKTLGFSTGRHLVLIAESDLNDPRMVTPKEAGGFGMDAQWSDDFHHALWSVIARDRSGYYEDFGSIEQLSIAIKEAFVYQGQYAPYRRRSHGRAVQGLPGYRFLAYIQNHDQVGNRATGERLNHVTNEGRVKVAAAIMLTAPGIPMLFAGEEFAASTPFQYFTDHEDAELGRLVSEGRRKEFAGFGWKPEDIPDPQDIQTFERSKLNWGDLDGAEHVAILDWYKKLIALRRSSKALVDGNLAKLEVRFDEDAKWIVIRRGGYEIACNLGETVTSLPLAAASEIVLSSGGVCKVEGNVLQIPPDSVAIVCAAQLSAAGGRGYLG